MTTAEQSVYEVSTNNFIQVLLPGEADGTVIRYDIFVAALFKQMSPKDMLNHAAMGIAGEAGEIIDAVKKHTIYGKELDRTNVIEELGDLRFYMQAMQNLLGITEQEVLQANANKLGKRYAGLVYSDQAAIAREDKV